MKKCVEEKTTTKYFIYDTLYGEYLQHFNGYNTHFNAYEGERLMIENREEAILTALLIQRRFVSTRKIEVYEVETKITKVERD